MSTWAKDALARGEITEEQAMKAAAGGAQIMEATPKWRPAPGEQPPGIGEASDPYIDMRRWCKDHPGEWAVIEGGSAKVTSRLRRWGFEALTRNSVRDEQGALSGDIWVRWPAPATEPAPTEEPTA